MDTGIFFKDIMVDEFILECLPKEKFMNNLSIDEYKGILKEIKGIQHLINYFDAI